MAMLSGRSSRSRRERSGIAISSTCCPEVVKGREARRRWKEFPLALGPLIFGAYLPDLLDKPLNNFMGSGGLWLSDTIRRIRRIRPIQTLKGRLWTKTAQL